MPWTVVIQIGVVLLFVWKLFGQVGRPASQSTRPDNADLRTSLQDSELASIRDFLKESTSTEARAYLRDKVFKAIDYAIRRHDWYEDQRSRVLQTATAISSGFLGIVGISIRVSSAFTPSVAITLVGMALIALFGLAEIIRLYRAELDRDRPYRLISDIRFWYFRYNLPDEGLPYEHAQHNPDQAQQVAAERRRFFSRIETNFRLTNSVREDIEQIFILQVLQRYKSESLTKMQDALQNLTTFLGAEVVLWLFTSVAQ